MQEFRTCHCIMLAKSYRKSWNFLENKKELKFVVQYFLMICSSPSGCKGCRSFKSYTESCCRWSCFGSWQACRSCSWGPRSWTRSWNWAAQLDRSGSRSRFCVYAPCRSDRWKHSLTNIRRSGKYSKHGHYHFLWGIVSSSVGGMFCNHDWFRNRGDLANNLTFSVVSSHTQTSISII